MITLNVRPEASQGRDVKKGWFSSGASLGIRMRLQTTVNRVVTGAAVEQSVRSLSDGR